MKVIAYKQAIHEVKKFHIKFLSTKWLHILLVLILHDIVHFDDKSLGDIPSDIFILFSFTILP